MFSGDAEVEILIDMERRPGDVRVDGSIDFHEVNFVPDATAGQVLATRIPPQEPEDGWDVCGRDLIATEAKNHHLIAGRNVSVETVDGIEHYRSSVEGMLKIAGGRELSVSELLLINGLELGP